MGTILIKNALIVSQNNERDILKGDIFIDGNKIMEIGKCTEDAERVIDASRMIALPGFVR